MTLIKKFSIVLWIVGGILAILVIVSWFVDYPKWLDQLLSNLLMVGLGLLMLFKAYRIRKNDRKFSMIYMIVGAILIAVALLSFTFVKVVAVIGLAIFLLTNRRVQKLINEPIDKTNQ